MDHESNDLQGTASPEVARDSTYPAIPKIANPCVLEGVINSYGHNSAKRTPLALLVGAADDEEDSHRLAQLGGTVICTETLFRFTAAS